MKKVVIIIFVLFVLFAAIRIGTSTYENMTRVQNCIQMRLDCNANN